MEKIFEGSISCKALLENQDRDCLGLYIDKKKKTKDFQYIRYLAHSRDCKIYEITREDIDTMCQGKTHGGICLKAKEKEKQILTKDSQFSGYCAYIDGLEDPYNLGSVIRTLYASGCKTLFLPYRDWSMSEQIILKASAGAYEKLSILWIEEDDTFIEALQSKNMPLLLANRKDSIPLDTYTFPKDFCIGIGGALRGIRAKIQNAASQNLHIRYGRDFKNALDTASAVAVFAFTITSQQQKEGN